MTDERIPRIHRAGPCPKHPNATVRYYLDAEPCFGCHPELLDAKASDPACLRPASSPRPALLGSPSTRSSGPAVRPVPAALW